MSSETLLMIITALQLLQTAVSSRYTATSAAMSAMGDVIKNLRNELNEKDRRCREISLENDFLRELLKKHDISIPIVPEEKEK